MRWKALAVAAGILVCSAPLHARITKIIIDETVSPAFCTVRKAATSAVAQKFLLQKDADALIAAAEASAVLK